MTTQTSSASMGAVSNHGASEQPAYWSGVFAMSLCVFALIASEFMPVSLLTPIAADLHVTEGMAGQGIAISGAFAVLTSLSISSRITHLHDHWLIRHPDGFVYESEKRVNCTNPS